MSKERTCLSVQDCIQHAIHRWDLTNVQTVYQTTAKAVLTADSGTYGPVIVILNELWTKHENSDLDYLEEIVRIISSKFNISVDDIRKLFIIEATLANIWRIEDGEPMQPQLFLLAEHMKHLL